MLEALKLNAEAVAAEEEEIRLVVRSLDDLQRRAYYAALKKEMKDPDTYAVLNYFFVAGLHHFYLGRSSRGLLNLLCMLGGLVLLFTPIFFIGILLIGGVVCIELMALFRAQIVVADYNNQLARTLLQQLNNAR